MIRKKVSFSYTAGFILFFFFVLSSCSLFPPLENYDVIKGKHCIVIMNSKDISTEVYKNICILGDNAYETVVAYTGLKFTQKIAITYYPGYNEEINMGIAYASSFSVFLSDDFLTLSADKKENTLQHEITHVIMNAYFGKQYLFVLTEGIAVYIGNDRSVPEPSGMKPDINEYFYLTYFDYSANYDYYQKDYLAFYIYMLSGEFVEFWCETYGMENFFGLYREAYLSNFNKIIEKYGDKSFEEIIGDFIYF